MSSDLNGIDFTLDEVRRYFAIYCPVVFYVGGIMTFLTCGLPLIVCVALGDSSPSLAGFPPGKVELELIDL